MIAKSKKPDLSPCISAFGKYSKKVQTLSFNHSSSFLYVEDCLWHQGLAKEIFNNLGFPLTIANNGLEALKLITQQPIHMIFMDIEMPDMNGFETTMIIRNTLRLTVPIVALTTLDSPKDIEKCRLVGMNDHLSKPLHPLKIQRTVCQWTGPI